MNTFQLYGGRELEIEGVVRRVDAVGNTWLPGVQGADAAGHYNAQLISGPVSSGPNFVLTGSIPTLQL